MADILKFQKLHSSAVLPSRGSLGACGLDLTSTTTVTLAPLERCAINVGLAVEIPTGFYGRIAPRSGLAMKYGIDVLAGVVDSDYRGELKCLVINLGQESFTIATGDRIAQLIIEAVSLPRAEWAEGLSATVRDAEGFGSTGNGLLK